MKWLVTKKVFLAPLRLFSLLYKKRECLPFVWKTRKFRGEFKWNGSSRWKFSNKKVIPFEVLPFPIVTETTEIFCTICLDYLFQASCREKAKNLPVFCKWYNSIPFLFSMPEKIPVPFDEIFDRSFRTNGKRPVFQALQVDPLR